MQRECWSIVRPLLSWHQTQYAGKVHIDVVGCYCWMDLIGFHVRMRFDSLKAWCLMPRFDGWWCDVVCWLVSWGHRLRCAVTLGGLWPVPTQSPCWQHHSCDLTLAERTRCYNYSSSRMVTLEWEEQLFCEKIVEGFVNQMWYILCLTIIGQVSS